MGTVFGVADPKNEIYVMHSFTLNQFTTQQRIEFENILKNFSLRKSVWRISIEWIGTPRPELAIQKYDQSEKILDIRIAECHGHGDWIKFKNINLNLGGI